MFSRMSGQRLEVQSDGEVPLDEILRAGVRKQPDVSALACQDGNQVSVMVWHYHDDDVAGSDANVTMQLRGLPARTNKARLTHYRIDEEHSNAFSLWKRMGSPQEPSEQQYTQLERKGMLEVFQQPTDVEVSDGVAICKFRLPRAAVSLVVLELAP